MMSNGAHYQHQSSSAAAQPYLPCSAVMRLAGESIPLMAAEEDPQHRRLLDHRERMEVMFWQEIAHYRTTDYLAFPPTLPPLCAGADREGVMSEQWRTRMCEWAYQLVDHFDFPRHIVGTCMNYLDRYLQGFFAEGRSCTSSSDGLPRIQKRHFQLVTMCCLYLAMKTRGSHRSIPIAYMCQLSRGTVSEQEMIDMEKELLARLSWLVNPPTAYDFLKHYLGLLHPPLVHAPSTASSSSSDTMRKNPRFSALEDLASFLVELSVLDYYFVNVRPSTIALAALFNAMDNEAGASNTSNNNVHNKHTHYHGFESLILPGEEPALHMARQRLASLYENAGADEDPSSAAAAAASSVDEEEDKEDETRTNSPVSVTNTGVHTVFYQQ